MARKRRLDGKAEKILLKMANAEGEQLLQSYRRLCSLVTKTIADEIVGPELLEVIGAAHRDAYRPKPTKLEAQTA